MKQVFLPAIVSVAILLTVGIVVGYILHKVTGIDLITALLGTAPGGLADITIMADPMGGSIVVASIHLSDCSQSSF